MHIHVFKEINDKGCLRQHTRTLDCCGRPQLLGGCAHRHESGWAVGRMLEEVCSELTRESEVRLLGVVAVHGSVVGAEVWSEG